MKVTFWGVRGSHVYVPPHNIASHEEFGFGTSCIEVTVGRRVMMFDAGSVAAHHFNDSFMHRLEAGKVDNHIDWFFSHGHYDHTLGLEQIELMFDRNIEKTLYIPQHLKWQAKKPGLSGAQVYQRLYGEPGSPELDNAHQATSIVTLKHGDAPREFASLRGHEKPVSIATFSLKHAKITSCGYAITHQGKKLCILTDLERMQDPKAWDRIDPALTAFIRNADVLIADGMYSEQIFKEMPYKKSFGHATGEFISELAREAGVKLALVTHHEPKRSDAELLAREKELQEYHGDTSLILARPRHSLDLGSKAPLTLSHS